MSHAKRSLTCNLMQLSALTNLAVWFLHQWLTFNLWAGWNTVHCVQHNVSWGRRSTSSEIVHRCCKSVSRSKFAKKHSSKLNQGWQASCSADWNANDSPVGPWWPVSTQASDSCSAVSRLFALVNQGRLQECRPDVPVLRKALWGIWPGHSRHGRSLHHWLLNACLPSCCSNVFWACLIGFALLIASSWCQSCWRVDVLGWSWGFAEAMANRDSANPGQEIQNKAAMMSQPVALHLIKHVQHCMYHQYQYNHEHFAHQPQWSGKSCLLYVQALIRVSNYLLVVLRLHWLTTSICYTCTTLVIMTIDWW